MKPFAVLIILALIAVMYMFGQIMGDAAQTVLP